MYFLVSISVLLEAVKSELVEFDNVLHESNDEQELLFKNQSIVCMSL
jgi:hypothetical protein